MSNHFCYVDEKLFAVNFTLCYIVNVIVKCKLRSCYDKKIQGRAFEKKINLEINSTILMNNLYFIAYTIWRSIDASVEFNFHFTTSGTVSSCHDKICIALPFPSFPFPFFLSFSLSWHFRSYKINHKLRSMFNEQYASTSCRSFSRWNIVKRWSKIQNVVEHTRELSSTRWNLHFRFSNIFNCSKQWGRSGRSVNVPLSLVETVDDIRRIFT